ncbi:DUF6362 family protein [Sphingobium sp. V4]|uniref:DUF6362 family protein n=1 Tax=Sphingobium sp. V4 TaxID=3038927 RepID=UPI0025581933|nr:DUF6362 family protein [Sphingobium sp. V4]WIW88975.1 DUF6362 family protein [Sphingobium sp. V4]
MYSFADVEERLIEAMLVMSRLSDREAGWLRVKASWPDIVREREAGDYDARGYLGNSSDIPIKPLPATRRDVDQMEQAFGWVLAAKPDDRRLIALAIGALARGAKRVPWMQLRKPMGIKLGAHGLRKRYERAMHLVTKAANAQKCAELACQTL